MGMNTIDARMVAKMFLAGAQNLEINKDRINELNVFPVPDGDTGTNMTLTIMAAAREVTALEELNMNTLARAMSSGSLRGARGNSGVILSQLLRGFSKVIRDYEEIDAAILANAMQKAVETAYKAVMKPKEGTILTVAKGMADKTAQLVSTVGDNLDTMIQEVIEHGEFVLSQTPEMLPVLKEAGVVDSGGQGLIEFLKGAYHAFLGKELTLSIEREQRSSSDSREREMITDQDDSILFGYCTEFMILADKGFPQKSEWDLKQYLESIGDSIVVVTDEDMVKVHVHTNDPGLAIQKALTYGALTSMKIDNMREEHQEKLIQMSQQKKIEKPVSLETQEVKKEEEAKEYGFIAVSAGEGMNEILTGLGVDYIIEGGQTMNPSTEDMMQAIEKVNAKNIYILPNNTNIILAANQTKSLIEGKEIIVIPTKTIPQGIAALIHFMPEHSPKENEDKMLEEIKKVKTGQVTYAVRDTVIDGKEIKQGNIMGIGDHAILSVGTIVENTARDMIKKLVDKDCELISIYYGKEVDEEIAEEFAFEITASYPECDVELHMGGQPIYYYIISVE
ncbi:DAK2 domain-containing protein [bacterium 1XD42-8]|nr:DAK2 domain-containing protein [Lachnospiraceae bacterium]RKJ43195.1 DAK2 domain-containing protein [bacterium 1XD42-8]